MIGFHPPCNNALKVYGPTRCSFDRSSLMSEVLRFSEKSVRPPSCESLLKFRAPHFFLIGNLETNWISLRRGDRKTVVHSHWSHPTVAPYPMFVIHSLRNFQSRGAFIAAFPIDKWKMTIKMFIAILETDSKLVHSDVGSKWKAMHRAVCAIGKKDPTAVEYLKGLSQDGGHVDFFKQISTPLSLINIDLRRIYLAAQCDSTL